MTPHCKHNDRKWAENKDYCLCFELAKEAGKSRLIFKDTIKSLCPNKGDRYKHLIKD